MSRDPNSLGISVLTSSSLWSLRDFLQELKEICHVRAADLFVLRDTDLLEMAIRGLAIAPSSLGESGLRKKIGQFLDRRPITSILERDDNCVLIAKWLTETLSSINGIQIVALATYFPDISSRDVTRRNRAVQALTNTVLLGSEILPDDRPLIVEVVSGSVLDACEPFSFVTPHESKLRILLKSLLAVVRSVVKVKPTRRIAVAIEMEPGNAYVLNDKNSIDCLLGLLEEPEFNELLGIVGLNADIWHYRIAGIGPKQFCEYQKHFVHAHISDGPGDHTRDHAIGSWTAYEPMDSEIERYLDVLARIRRGETDLPWSRHVALELEGNNRCRFINSSVVAMRQVIVRCLSRMAREEQAAAALLGKTMRNGEVTELNATRQ